MRRRDTDYSRARLLRRSQQGFAIESARKSPDNGRLSRVTRAWRSRLSVADARNTFPGANNESSGIARTRWS